MIQNGSYLYMEDLLQLEQCHLHSFRGEVPQEWLRMSSPLTPKVKMWETGLSAHPDPRFTQYIINGISHGFHIGFQEGCTRLQSSTHNLGSAAEHPEVVERYLQKEVTAGRLIGPVPRGELTWVHCSPFPKKSLGHGVLSYISPHQTEGALMMVLVKNGCPSPTSLQTW